MTSQFQEKASDPPGSTQATDSKAQAVQEEDDPPEAQVGDRRAFAARGSQEDASAALGATAMVQAEVQADPVAEPAKEPEDDEHLRCKNERSMCFLLRKWYDCEVALQAVLLSLEFEPDFSEEEDDRELTQRSDAATSPRGTASKSETSELQANLERPSAENSSETNKVVGLPLSQKAEEADQTDSRRSMAMSFKDAADADASDANGEQASDPVQSPKHGTMFIGSELRHALGLGEIRTSFDASFAPARNFATMALLIMQMFSESMCSLAQSRIKRLLLLSSPPLMKTARRQRKELEQLLLRYPYSFVDICPLADVSQLPKSGPPVAAALKQVTLPKKVSQGVQRLARKPIWCLSGYSPFASAGGMQASISTSLPNDCTPAA
ncbi:unnamed protein product [Symbiodinium sp. KB8]|nr:unnamed protein product [Symbiodinium sp. KB8]